VKSSPQSTTKPSWRPPANRRHHRQDECPAGAPVIAALYAASQAGVKIDLIIRAYAPCAPELPACPTTSGALGGRRFLEHTRIFYFRNGGDEKVFLSSADWMDATSSAASKPASPSSTPS